jgi:predicted porin
MKKHLIAAAVAAAVAVPAMAQNVSLSGIIDQSVQYSKTDGKPSATNLVHDLINSSRLTFRGTEDLGGGLKAFFRLEQTIIVDEGGQNNGWNRGSEVGISGAFGSVKVGKFDLTQAEGIDSFAGQFGNVSNTASGFDITNDKNDSIQYELPRLNGWRVQLGHSLGDDNVESGVKAARNSVSVSGKLGVANVAIGYQDEKISAGKTKLVNVGVNVPVGPATVGVYYGDKNIAGTSADQDYLILSAKMPIAAGLNVHAMWSSLETKGSADKDQYAIGLVKDLSKRTSVYAAYIADENFTTANKDSTNFAIGISHSF